MSIRGFAAVGFLALTAAAASAEDDSMQRFRSETMAGIHAENRAALERSLHESQSALAELTRETWLAQQPPTLVIGQPTAKSAP